MEPKQHYLIVGVFVIAALIGLAGFAAWLSGMNDNNIYDTYQTFTTESVNGLSVGSLVKYRGVEVGKVSVIEISRSNPSKIHIVMDVKETTPITQGTVAVIQIQGITGISYIELKGARAGAEKIPLVGKNKIPIIPSAPSEFRQIVDTVPDMLQKFTDLANKLGNFASDENQKRFDNILINMEKFSSDVGGENGSGQSLVKELEAATNQMSLTATKIGTLSDNTNKLTQQGYSDIRQLLLELKKTARDMQGLSQSLKENPSQIVIPPQQGGVSVPKE